MSRFCFDSILLPYNDLMHLNERYRNEFDEVVRICQESNTAVQTIKSIARGPWGITPQNRNTWYQPLEEQEDIDRAVHWVLGRPNIFLNTVGDVKLLRKVLDAASFSKDAQPIRKWTNSSRETKCHPFSESGPREDLKGQFLWARQGSFKGGFY